ncbi:LacI family DNA-binding transcriptional regulator [Clostridium sp.]|uniref:LacI family DNA-binding transcriptional regulator n=1 Tax=Clostridium sp. TaxID=1506 RepID=UPI002A912529|nr:LacI family DNA-binding transcriptional regulator [Clostridium sp.]MDY6011978.1 LacI family DNA-binding transcriptional regulator [Clostridium sp.]
MKKNITFDDIAKYTNFSKTTISRYFNFPETLSADSIKKIKKALTELNYTENKVARSLASGNTEMIGIIIPNLFLHYYSQILNNLIQTYNKYNYKFLVFLGDSNPDEEIKYIKELMSYKIEGLIMLSHSIDSLTLKNLNIPIVAIEREDEFISSINSDNYSGSVKATNLLIDNNCDILIHINSHVDKNIPAYKRIEGFKETCKKNNKNYEIYFSDLGSSFEESYDSLHKIYTDIEKKYTGQKKGIFLSNDTYANIFLNILVRNKKSIPGEYELIGFDNSPICKEAIIPITTIGQDITKISECAMKSLLRQINLKKKNKLHSIDHITIDTNLFIRETTSSKNYS